MIEVFSSMSAAEVSVRRAMLEEAEIPTFVRNESLSTLANAMAAPFQPALCVLHDEDYERAMGLLRTLNAPDWRADWICPQCKESVPGSFDSCWNCESMKPETLVA